MALSFADFKPNKSTETTGLLSDNSGGLISPSSNTETSGLLASGDSDMALLAFSSSTAVDYSQYTDAPAGAVETSGCLAFSAGDYAASLASTSGVSSGGASVGGGSFGGSFGGSSSGGGCSFTC